MAIALSSLGMVTSVGDAAAASCRLKQPELAVGLMPGEAAAALLVEPQRAAERRGGKVLRVGPWPGGRLHPPRRARPPRVGHGEAAA